MTTLRKALLAAFKTLLRGRSFLQALFAFWVSPRPPTSSDVRVDGKLLSKPAHAGRSLDDFLKEAEELLLQPVERDGLHKVTAGLKGQFRERLDAHPESMLPSYSHLLPTGSEIGRYVALDVGGSTLRVALVELRGRDFPGRAAEVIEMSTIKITPEIKALEGMAFFDWMAARMAEVIPNDDSRNPDVPIPLGMAWSFPVDQISFGGGLLLSMGKGFLATKGLMGQDLGQIIKFACKKQNLNVELAALVNDGSATLLSRAYTHESTRFGLILGTGVNIAVHLPVSSFSRSKFGNRPESWFEAASHVICNTELGMFGTGVLPAIKWDHLLRAGHPRPEFQPLEHLTSGYYLGEVCRFAIIEAVETAGLLGGVLPPSLEKPYSLDTETISRIEGDTSPTLETALAYFTELHPSSAPPTLSDMTVIRTLASMISRRSSALLACCIFSLWELRHEAETEYINSRPGGRTPSFVAQAEIENTLPQTMVAYNGSVIEHYPGYRENCQQYIDALVAESKFVGSVGLVPAGESALLGAAVALACVAEED